MSYLAPSGREASPACLIALVWRASRHHREGRSSWWRRGAKVNKKPRRYATVRRDEALCSPRCHPDCRPLLVSRRLGGLFTGPSWRAGPHPAYLSRPMKGIRDFLPPAAWKRVRAALFSRAPTLPQVAVEAPPPTGLPHRGPYSLVCALRKEVPRMSPHVKGGRDAPTDFCRSMPTYWRIHTGVDTL